MTQIQSIHLTIETGRMDNAGTDGDVYLGVCGREFFVDTSSDDFERASGREYIFGEGANVNNQSDNDPRTQDLQIENVERFPVYLRFQPLHRGDKWNLSRAVITFNNDLSPQWETTTFVFPNAGIWLGPRAGLYVHLDLHRD
jgi:hypothetical protein